MKLILCNNAFILCAATLLALTTTTLQSEETPQPTAPLEQAATPAPAQVPAAMPTQAISAATPAPTSSPAQKTQPTPAPLTPATPITPFEKKFSTMKRSTGDPLYKKLANFLDLQKEVAAFKAEQQAKSAQTFNEEDYRVLEGLLNQEISALQAQQEQKVSELTTAFKTASTTTTSAQEAIKTLQKILAQLDEEGLSKLPAATTLQKNVSVQINTLANHLLPELSTELNAIKNDTKKTNPEKITAYKAVEKKLTDLGLMTRPVGSFLQAAISIALTELENPEEAEFDELYSKFLALRKEGYTEPRKKLDTYKNLQATLKNEKFNKITLINSAREALAEELRNTQRAIELEEESTPQATPVAAPATPAPAQ